MKHPSLRAVAALAAVLAAAPAWADQAASVSLTGLTYTLYDLNPSDGIAPALTFASPSVYPWDSVETYTWGSGDADRTASGSTVLAPLAAQIAVPGVATAAASVSGTLEGGGVTLQASATSAAPPSYTVATVSVFGDDSHRNFTLTPSTMVVFNAAAALSATSNDQYPYAHALASLELLGGGSHQSWSGYASAGQSLQESFGLSLVNPSSLDMTGYLKGSLYASTIAMTSPVPEPGPAGLLPAGLALLGAAGRRARPSSRG
jgi:hypothetical protein